MQVSNTFAINTPNKSTKHLKLDYRPLKQLSMVGALMLVFFLNGCATQTKAPSLIDPFTAYSGSKLIIHSPNSAGWHQIRNDSGGMTFAKYLSGNGTLIASVLGEPIDQLLSPTQLLKYVEQKVSKEDLDNSERFTIRDQQISIETSRPYPCVSARLNYLDKQAQLRKGGKGPLFLNIINLSCQFSSMQDRITLIGYSYRGDTPTYTPLQQEAQAFISSVQIPE